MKKFIASSLALISLSLVLFISISAQQIGTRVDANIPFDFVVGDETFSAGNYQLKFVRQYGSVYNVLLLNDKGRMVMNTVAIQNGSTVRGKSDLVFAVSDGGHFLEKFRTPDAGYRFNWSAKDKTVAEAKRVNVPADSGPNAN